MWFMHYALTNVHHSYVWQKFLENRPYGYKYLNIFLPVRKSYTYALSRDTKHLRLDCWFFRCCQIIRVYFMAYVAPKGH